MRHDQDLFWPFLALLLAALIWPAAATASTSTTWARETGWVLRPDGGGVYQTLPESGRGGQHSTTCTTVACQRTGSVVGPLGKPPPTLSPTATFPVGNIARSAAALGARILPWWAVGSALYDWYNAAGVTVDAAGQPYYSEGATTPASAEWGVNAAYGLGRYSTPQALCQAFGQKMAANTPGTLQTYTWPDASQNGGTCQAVILKSNGTTQTFNETASKFFGSFCADSSGVTVPTIGSQCSAGVRVDLSPLQVEDRLKSAPVTSSILRQALQDILDAGGTIQSSGTTVTGPSSAPGASSSVTSTSPGSGAVTVVTTTVYNYTYNGSTVTVTESKQTTNPDGSTVEEIAPPRPLCGVPGSPACAVKVDETGTPAAEPFSASVFGELAAQDAAARDAALSSVPQPSFGFLNAPPLAACRPYQYPYGMGEIDACNVVEPVRAVMAYLWALAGAWLCIGWIRSTVTGGA